MGKRKIYALGSVRLKQGYWSTNEHSARIIIIRTIQWHPPAHHYTPIKKCYGISSSLQTWQYRLHVYETWSFVTAFTKPAVTPYLPQRRFVQAVTLSTWMRQMPCSNLC